MAQAARKVTTKDANAKLAHRRLTVLELAERLGNVAEACRRGGIDRTSFYDWKRRFQLHGLDGLKDLPPIAKSHPMTTPVEVVERIVGLALLHPAYGCNRLEALLALEGRRLSAITIQKILNDKGLGTRHERWLALERHNAEQAIELSPEQAAFLRAVALVRETAVNTEIVIIGAKDREIGRDSHLAFARHRDDVEEFLDLRARRRGARESEQRDQAKRADHFSGT